MRIAFLNPQGNFDPEDRYWTAHSDFGGQLVYVKEVALALGRMGHDVDIVTRRIRDAEWKGFEESLDRYPGEAKVRIVRLPCGGDRFLAKEELWPYLGTEWVPNLVEFYAREGRGPEAVTTHYGDGGLAGALWKARGGPPFTFTGHSLGAQKLDRLLAQSGSSLEDLEARYRFTRRIAAERVAMNHAARIVTSTEQERQEQYGHPAYAGAVNPDDDGRFAVVPPGVNLRIFSAATEGPEDARIAGYLERMVARDIAPERRGYPAILCSSRLDPKKNHIGLVRAFAESVALREAANLLIVVRGAVDIHSRAGLAAAEGGILDEIVALVEGAGLWGAIGVFSLVSQQELAAAYRHLHARRSAFALTALYEPFGLAPLEAMAAGLPAVVTRNGGPSESLCDTARGEEYGVLVDPTDAHDIAAGLLRLVGPDNEWERMQRAGLRRVAERVLQQDDYFVFLPKTNHEMRRRNLEQVGPYEVKLDFLDSNLRSFKRGESPIYKPLVVYDEDRITTEEMEVGGLRVLIAEGTYTTLLRFADLRVFIDRDYHQTLEARMRRARDKFEPFVLDVLEREHQIISKHRGRADVVVSSDFGRIEVQSTGSRR